MNNLTQIAVSLAGFSDHSSRFVSGLFFSISPEEVSSGVEKEKEDSGRINTK